MAFNVHVSGVFSVPYSAGLPFQLSDGKEIIIKGTVVHHCDRFSINLCSGPDMDSDIALHFNPRFDQHSVVRNHEKGGWGSEEKHGGLPFHKGHAYEVKIVVRHHAYQIFVNNSHFCDFNHRLPKEIVHYVYISGDTKLHGVDFNDLNAPSFPNPPVPFTTPIHGGMQHGRTFFIDGIPRHGASRFSVNLLCGPNFDYDDIGLHFDVRFNYGNSHHVVVRTHRAGGSWGEEEKHHSYFPFAHNAPFAMQILVEHHHIKVAVNNQHFIEFRHRIHPVHRVNHLNVQGDVNLTNVRIM